MEVSLAQILASREHRAARQRQLLDTFRKPLICFTMNIAGPIKNSPLITEGFRLGQRYLQGQLSGLRPLHFEESIAPTGCEGYYIVDANPRQLKALTVQIEDGFPVGRLFDMDVLTPQGEKVSRESMGLPGRKCLLCGNPVHLCSSRRAHPLVQIQEKTTALLREAIIQEDSQRIGAAAVRSLLYEVSITPKPGLVDRENSGSHWDMDFFTFLDSAASLQPYFVSCARIGLQTQDAAPEKTFAALRLPGKLAEQAMMEATGGVNTHKGAIFSLGILCAAAGRLEKPCRSPEAICREIAAMTAGLTARELRTLTPEAAATNGQRLYAQYGITGIRGQAEAGFPAVLRAGLPILEEGLGRGLSLNDAGCAALLHLMCETEDTNLIARSDLATWQTLQSRLRTLLEASPFPTRQQLEALDREFTEKNLSPGGTADLLAASLFLHFIRE